MPYEPPKYPGAIPTAEDLPDRVDDVDWLYAARYNELKKELRAALIELGVDPAGAYATVVARLDALGVVDKISEGDSSVEVIDTDADGHVDIKTENVLCGKFNSDGILDLPKQSSAWVRVGTGQVIAHNTLTKLELDTESWDIQNEFDKDVNYRFTAKKAGKYAIVLAPHYLASVDGKMYTARIYKNGAVVQSVYIISGVGGAELSPLVASVVNLAANDHVEGWVWHNAGVNQTVQAFASRSYMSIHKVA